MSAHVRQLLFLAVLLIGVVGIAGAQGDALRWLPTVILIVAPPMTLWSRGHDIRDDGQVGSAIGALGAGVLLVAAFRFICQTGVPVATALPVTAFAFVLPALTTRLSYRGGALLYLPLVLLAEPGLGLVLPAVEADIGNLPSLLVRFGLAGMVLAIGTGFVCLSPGQPRPAVAAGPGPGFDSGPGRNRHRPLASHLRRRPRLHRARGRGRAAPPRAPTRSPGPRTEGRPHHLLRRPDGRYSPSRRAGKSRRRSEQPRRRRHRAPLPIPVDGQRSREAKGHLPSASAQQQPRPVSAPAGRRRRPDDFGPRHGLLAAESESGPGDRGRPRQ